MIHYHGPRELSEIASQYVKEIQALVQDALNHGIVITVDTVAKKPLAMGHYEMRTHVRPARDMYAQWFAKEARGEPLEDAPVGYMWVRTDRLELRSIESVQLDAPYGQRNQPFLYPNEDVAWELGSEIPAIWRKL